MIDVKKNLKKSFVFQFDGLNTHIIVNVNRPKLSVGHSPKDAQPFCSQKIGAGQFFFFVSFGCAASGPSANRILCKFVSIYSIIGFRVFLRQFLDFFNFPAVQVKFFLNLLQRKAAPVVSAGTIASLGVQANSG